MQPDKDEQKRTVRLVRRPSQFLSSAFQVQRVLSSLGMWDDYPLLRWKILQVTGLRGSVVLQMSLVSLFNVWARYLLS